MAYSISLYDQKGNQTGTFELNADIYNDEVVNTDLIHEYILLQQSNRRQSTAHTKTRWDVKWSGRKLYRQKGTGSARVGDAQSPIRVGGGVTFGPSNEKNYTKKMNKNMRRKALRGVIALKAADNALAGITDHNFSAPKTKDAIVFLQGAEMNQSKILLVVNEVHENFEKSFANIPSVKQVRVQYLNPVDLLQAHTVLFTQDALEAINTVD